MLRQLPGYVTSLGNPYTSFAFPSAFGYPFNFFNPYLFNPYLFNRYFYNPYGYFGYPYGYLGYPYGYPLGYGYPYGGYGFGGYGGGYSGSGYGGMILGGLPGLGGSGSNGGGQAGGEQAMASGPAAKEKQPGADLALIMMDKILESTGVPTKMGKLDWPTGLKILPGAESLRERIDGLYETASAQALAGKLNPGLRLQMKRAVHELQRFVAWDKQEKLTLSSSMYEEAQFFLRKLDEAAELFPALSFPGTNRYVPGLLQTSAIPNGVGQPYQQAAR